MTQNAPEKKLIKALRILLSFVLAVIIATLSLGVCFSTEFLDASKIEKYFTCYEYTNGVRNDVLTYAKGFYTKNGLADDKLEDIISYDAVKAVTENYAGHYISSRVGYDENAYLKSIQEVAAALKADIAEQVAKTQQSENAGAVDAAVKSISNYFANEVEIKGAEHIETLFNIGEPAGYAVIGVCAFFFIFISLILFFLGEKRYRSLRAISISFFTAGLFQICLSGIVLIISQIKKFDIYPLYLYNQFMAYLYSCLGTVVLAGFITFVIGIAIAAFTWINKVKGKR